MPPKAAKALGEMSARHYGVHWHDVRLKRRFEIQVQQSFDVMGSQFTINTPASLLLGALAPIPSPVAAGPPAIGNQLCL